MAALDLSPEGIQAALAEHGIEATDEMSFADQLREAGIGQAYYDSLTPQLRALVPYSASLFLRPKQRLSLAARYRIIVFLAGRGWGKTYSGAAWLKQQIFEEGCRVVAVVGQAHKDVYGVMLRGPAGLFNMLPPELWPTKDAETGALVFPDGQQMFVMYGDHFERIRGFEFEAVWIDEFAKYRDPTLMWQTIMPAIRGKRKDRKSPITLFTTTPKPNATLRRFKQRFINGDDKVLIVPGSTMDNAKNLDEGFLEELIEEHPPGTRKYRQEVMGELLDETEDSLWTLESFRTYTPPALVDEEGVVRDARDQIVIDWDAAVSEMSRVVISVDPAGTNSKYDDEGDMTGIIVVGVRASDKRAVVLWDHTLKDRPEVWGEKVVTAYHKYQADCVIGEVNYGGDMVRANIHAIDDRIPYRPVRASRGQTKSKRAAPAATLYTRGKVLHLRVQGGDGRQPLAPLEDQMCQMCEDDYYGPRSPDRVDALVWALTYLFRLDKDKRNVAGPITSKKR